MRRHLKTTNILFLDLNIFSETKIYLVVSTFHSQNVLKKERDITYSDRKNNKCLFGLEGMTFPSTTTGVELNFVFS